MSNRAFNVLPGTRYLLLLVQNQEGCDYTIGCGMKALPLEAQTVEGARTEAKGIITKSSDDGGDGYLSDYIDLSEALLITAREYLPIGTWRAELKAQEQAATAKEQELKELAELERLKAKYGR